MKNNFILLAAFTALFFMQGCQKNMDAFIQDASGAAGTDWQNTVTLNSPVAALRNDLSIMKVADSFAYNSAGTFSASGDLALSVPPGALSGNAGTLPTGIIRRQSLLVRKKGDFIAMSMPTVSNGRLLVSGGAYFLGLKNNNEELQVPQGQKIYLQYTAIAPAQNMRVFNGMEDITVGYNWTLNGDTAFNKVDISQNGYEVQTNKLHWLHTARFVDTAGIAQTTLSLNLPANYTNTNTVAYISFNDFLCVTDIPGNAALRKFVSGNLPVNRSVTVVVLSKQSGDYYLGKMVTNTSSTVTIAPELVITPVKTSLADIRTYLQGL